LASVLTQDGRPDDIDLHFFVLYNTEYLVLHLTGAILTRPSGGR
jgi:hypothetical protein